MKDKIFKKGMHSIGAKIVSLALTFMLVVTMIPTSAFVSTASAATVEDKVSDYSTINEWQDYFLNGDTEYAGGVWTDKSVFKSGSDFDAALSRGEAKTGIETGEDNFLISMSALATNKEIVGYSTIPTDTIFIIDVSQSMDNSKSIPQTVNAANSAIKKLLELNKNNRVGIILYSGRESGSGSTTTSTATKLLGLDRYLPGNGGRYITYTGNDDTTVKTETNLKYESTGRNVSSKSKHTIGGTYIQNGLDYAMVEFLNADPLVKEENIQEGEIRMPVFVLLSDGAPTHATTSYTDIGTSNMGTGGSTTASSGTGFATQLTAAYARAKVEKHYGRDARFYTLGLNLAEATGHAVATSVLDPESSYNAINTYWDNLFLNGSTKVTAHATNGKESNDFTISRPSEYQNGKRVYTDLLTRESQYYVDEYFEVSNNDKLEDAFNNIVAQIILQSAYYPTHIEGSERDLSGYITFRDRIGHYMEVKDMKGILLGDKLFTGETLAKMMKEGEFGNAGKYTEKGWELVETVAERIGVSEAEAINLLNYAWRDKQLYYDDARHYGNYIGWYEGADSQYIAFWSQNDDDADIQAAVSSGAKYITKSYGYYGATEEGSILGSDMMHVVVKLRTEIATGLQEVIFEIPASLIPIITYDITLDADSYDNANKITMEIGDETPIRLLFEVGMSPEINENNLTAIMTAEEAHNHPVYDAQGNPTGEYYFYTNIWAKQNDPSGLDPSKHEVAESVFTPSTVNERYYYTEDSVIYVKSGDSYTEYKGDAAPTGSEYYRAYRVFELTGVSNNAKLGYVYESIAAETLTYNNGENIAKNEDGEWYIKKGSVRKTLPSYHIEKRNDGSIGGPTETLRYSRYAQILEDENVEDYQVFSYQGNNGRLKMAPATGIKLTKQVDATVTDANAEFVFNVELDNESDETYALVKNEVESKIKFTNGKSEDIVLKAGETVYIAGLPAGVKYIITEQNNEDYKVAGITVNGTAANEASGTLVDKEYQDVVFTNTERNEGDLVITKTVKHNLGNDYVIPLNKKFTGKVTLKDAEGNVLANVQLTTSTGNITTAADGSVPFELAHDESLTIYGLDEGTKYVVEETTIPAGFQLSKESDTTGTIVADQTAEATLVNEYTPKPPELGLTVDVDKVLIGLDDWDDRTFEFELQQQSTEGWKTIDTGSVNESNKSVDLDITADKFTSVGNYLFRIVEIGSYTGIVNDTNKYFTVVVTDADMDGVLEISQVIRMNESVDFKDNTIKITFNNEYVVEGDVAVQIPITKKLINETGVLLRPDGFVFGLFKSNNEGKSYDVKVTEAKSNAAGEAVINMTYDKDSLDGKDEVTFKYELREIAGNMAGVTYSEKAYMVTVTIGVSNHDVVLEGWTITEKDGTEVKEAEFVNEYKVEPVRINIAGQKVLNGRGIKVGDDFEFKLYKADANFKVSEDAVDTTTADQDGGSFALAHTIEKAGTYYYVVEETAGDVPGVTYDTTKYHVTVVVDVDPHNSEKLKVISKTYSVVGGTTVDGDKDLTFTNEYKTKPVSVEIKGNKVLTAKDKDGNVLEQGQNIASREFTFVLLKADGKTPVKDAEGNDIVAVSGLGIAENGVAETTFTFPAIEYTAAGEYDYVIAERNDGKAGYTYDATEYNVTVNVVDNGEGVLEATISDSGKNIVFNNVYTPEPASITLDATKKMDGRPLEDEEFNFGIYATASDFNADGKEPIQIVSNDGAGNIDFEPISIKERGTYYYVMKEIVPDPEDSTYDSNVVYDPAEYHITVTAWDVDGKLYARVTSALGGGVTDMLFFSNVYVEPDPVSITLTAEKELDGRELKAGEFKFKLVELDAEGEETGTPQIVTNGAGDGQSVNKVSFDSITYTETGTYRYKISEVEPEGSDRLGGVTYDDSVINVTVEVTDNGQGALVATINSEDVSGEEVPVGTFVNEYTTSSASIELSATKELTGRDLRADEFEFEISRITTDAPLPEKTKVKNAADGSVDFGMIEFETAGEYQYKITEVVPDEADKLPGVTYDAHESIVVINVTDKLDGTMEAVIADASIGSLKFNNTYTPEPIKVSLDGTKELTGRTLGAEEFEFEIKAITAGAPMPGVTTVKNAADGTVNFSDIVYTEAGTYEYEISETKGDLAGITYDESKVKATVKVTYDATTGLFDAKVSYDGEGFVFENTYNTKPITIELAADKTVIASEGNNYDIKAGDFEFELTPADSNPDSDPVETAVKIENDADGKVDLGTLEFTETGEYNYTVREVSSGIAGMSYDDTVYEINVKVTDDEENAQLVAVTTITKGTEKVDSIVFENAYDPKETSVNFDGKKVLDSEHKDLAEKQFTFELKDAEGNVIDTATNTAAGTFQFGSITYDRTGTFEYTVTEVNDGKEGYIYDDTVHKVTVVVTDEGGVLKAGVTGGTADDIVFTNGYIPGMAKMIVTGDKALNGRDMKEGEFSFAILDGEEELATGTNNADGKIIFSALTFKKEGTYNYTIVEKNTNIAGVTYDQIVYGITVKVVDEDGQLKVESTDYIKNGNVVDEIAFSNTYVPAPTVIKLGAVKVMEGRDLSEGEFTFALEDAAGKVVYAVNDAAGAVQFDEITFDATGTYKYKIYEKAGDAEHVTYDKTVHEITVKVTDDLKGNLKAEVVEGTAVPTFVNTYEPPYTPTNPEVTIEKFQAVNDGEMTKETLTAAGEDVVTYRLVVKNIGTESAKNVVITDEVPEGLTLLEGTVVITEGNVAVENDVITGTIEELKAGAEVQIEFEAVVPEVTEATTYTNVGTVDYTNDPEDPDNSKGPESSNEVVVTVEPVPPQEEPTVPPTEPEKPAEPTKPMDETSDGGTQTGDDFNAGLYGFLALAALAVAGAAFRRRKTE